MVSVKEIKASLKDSFPKPGISDHSPFVSSDSNDADHDPDVALKHFYVRQHFAEVRFQILCKRPQLSKIQYAKRHYTVRSSEDGALDRIQKPLPWPYVKKLRLRII